MSVNGNKDHAAKNKDPEKRSADLSGCDTLIAAAWFDTDAKNILSSIAAYKIAESFGRRPAFLGLPGTLSSFSESAACSKEDILSGVNIAPDDISFEELANCTLFIACGSIWDYKSFGKKAGTYFSGAGLTGDIRKISFSSSFSDPIGSVPLEYLLGLKEQLSSYNGVSAAGLYESGVFQELFDIVPEIICDPVLLCGPDIYKELIGDIPSEDASPYIFADLSVMNKNAKQFAQRASLIRKLPCKYASDIFTLKMSAKKPDISSPGCACANWLSALSRSEFVITDSYPGICFALTFKKPFIAIAAQESAKQFAQEDLLESIDLKERLVFLDGCSDMNDYMYLFRKDIDYSRVYGILDIFKEDSLSWIEEETNGR